MPRLAQWIADNLWAIIVAAVSVIYGFATVNSKTDSRLATIEAAATEQKNVNQRQDRLLVCIIIHLKDTNAGGDSCRGDLQ